MIRADLRLAMETKVEDIEKVFYPQDQQVFLKVLSAVDKVMKELEQVPGVEVTKDDLIQALIRAAQINGEDYSNEEILSLADKIMVQQSFATRDQLRNVLIEQYYDVSRTIREPEEYHQPFFSLQISNLSSVTSDRDLLKYFQDRGYNLEDTSIIYSKDDAHSLCYGYLNFATKEEANRCLAEMNGCIIDDSITQLSDDIEEELNTRVKATNLPLDFDQRRVRALFKHYGNLKSCKLEKNHDGSSRGIGLIQYENRANAETAIYNLDGKKLGKHRIRVKIHDFLKQSNAKFVHEPKVEKKVVATNPKYSSAFTFSAPP